MSFRITASFATLSVSALVLFACSSDPLGEDGADASAECSTGADCESGLCVGGTCQPAAADAGGGVDDAFSGFDTGVTDTGVDGATIEDSVDDSGPEAGTLGAPCDRDADCDSGFCIRTSEGDICSELCRDDCPDGYECRLLQNQAGDAVQLCVPADPVLCRECEEDLDCDGTSNLCIPLDDGTFCGVPCGDGCPEGYSCEPFSRGADIVDNCVPDLGICGGCLDLDGDGYGVGDTCAGTDCDENSAAAASVFEGAVEVCDGRDNNCDGVTDEGFDTASDPQNCGTCGVVCETDLGDANGFGVCIDSVCTVDLCDPGYFDINERFDDGCEYACVVNSDTDGIELCNERDDDCDGEADEDYDLDSDPNHCGACNNTCDLAGSDSECRDGACRIATCEAPFEDCDAVAENGCEVDLSASLLHCGACDNACDLPNVSIHECRESDGAYGCAIVECDEGFDDCDGDPANGCEVNLLTNVDNCGTCTNACSYENGTGLCVDGACRLDACDADYGDCDADTSNGCEEFLRFNDAHCGGCGAVCAAANGNAVCRETSCDFLGCLPGFDNCDGDLGNGCETDIWNTLTDCGGCGSVCARDNAGEVCMTGICTLGACAANFGDCNFNPIDGCETSLMDNNSHCGGCGNRCDAVFTDGIGSCVGTSCELTGCRTGYGDCNSDSIDGCETDVFESLSHCGACDAPCERANGMVDCSGGRCLLLGCEGSYENCDRVDENGCEVDINADLLNCGGCGIPCEFDNGIAECNTGSCDFAGCQPGWTDLDGSLDNGCEYECVATPGPDLPDAGGIDSDCDGIDGDADGSVYVATPVNGGNDGNDGRTRSTPVATLARAITIAQGCGCDVLVSGGSFNETVTLASGIDIYGGYNSVTWSRDIDANTTRIRATENRGVIANSLSSATILDGVTVEGRDYTTGGQSTYAIWVNGTPSERLTIANVSVEAGNGGSGAAGSSGSNGSNGGSGRNGSGAGGGGAGTSSCGATGGGGGSAYNCGSNTGGNGSAGTDPRSGGAGGGGGSNSCGGGCGSDSGGDGRGGGDGGNGASGSTGSTPGDTDGDFSGGYFTNSTGSSAARGRNGTGGGGGGSGGTDKDTDWYCIIGSGVEYGGGGGGGGGGGCGGNAGTPGGTGGGSFGIVAINSTINVQNTSVTRGNGGNGGAGGAGGDGGSGGGRGAGVSREGSSGDDGGNGAAGGVGGDGGGGGGAAGGCGGPSVGIAIVGSSTVNRTGVTYAGGSGGRGGSGGLGGLSGDGARRAPSGGTGCTGARADTVRY